MKTPIYIHRHDIVSSLGFSTAENFNNLECGLSGVQEHFNEKWAPHPIWASVVHNTRLEYEFSDIGNVYDFTRLERMMLLCAHGAIGSGNIDPESPDTIFIIATTKGNIDPFDQGRLGEERPTLSGLARVISGFFGNPNAPIVVCNACISGVLALDVAKRLLRRGKYQHAVVVAGDILSEFVVSGFQCFKAMSETRCRPYDVARNGINLGEGAAAMVLSVSPVPDYPVVKLDGAASSNDANHISGPSRGGEGLFSAIEAAILDADGVPNFDYLCMHGTATVYNDEMEAKALKLAGLTDIPMHSLKGFFGHTLGAAGLIESAIVAESMYRSFLIQSLGFQELGVSENLNVIRENTAATLRRSLKTASGFGGCNAAAIFSI